MGNDTPEPESIPSRVRTGTPASNRVCLECGSVLLCGPTKAELYGAQASIQGKEAARDVGEAKRAALLGGANYRDIADLNPDGFIVWCTACHIWRVLGDTKGGFSNSIPSPS